MHLLQLQYTTNRWLPKRGSGKPTSQSW